MAENGDQGVSIGRIPLKQVRVKRCDEPESARVRNPMNALVPYLDLFCRLDDEALARLAHVEPDIVASLREQVVAVDEGLAPYADLLNRLSDEELVRLSGATPKTIRFWRLCQPRVPTEMANGGTAPAAWVARAARQCGGMQAPECSEVPPPPSELEPTGPSDSGLHDQALTATDPSPARLRDLADEAFAQYGADDSGPVGID